MPIGTTRRIGTVHVELDELQAVRAALGGKVNDVVLCAATGALRELLLARGEDLPRQGLRAMVPVNIRQTGDHGGLGNKVSTLFVELPVAEADPLRRYHLVRVAVEKRKAGGQAHAASAVTGLTELAPPVLHASLARSLYAKRLFNITITNVPASPRRLYAFGAPMIDVVPIVPLAAEHAVAIAVVSYAGGVTFGSIRRSRHHARSRRAQRRHRRPPCASWRRWHARPPPHASGSALSRPRHAA